MFGRKKTIDITGDLVVFAPDVPFESMYSSYSMFRGFTSPHTRDLATIFFAILLFFVGASALGVFLSEDYLFRFSPNGDASSNVVADDGSTNFFNAQTLVLIGAGGFIATCISLYEIGKRRFATVDLISMEILTIVRLLATSSFVHRTGRLYQEPSGDSSVHKNSGLAYRSEAAASFLQGDHCFNLFHDNMKELGALNSNVVDYVTAFYTFLKSVKEQSKTFNDYLAGAEEVDQEAVNTHIRLIMFLTDTLMSCAHRAFESLVESPVHKAAATRMSLVVAADANNFLYQILSDNHAMKRYTDKRREQYFEALLELEALEKKVHH